MGRLNADAFAENIKEGTIKLEDAILWHLKANHYPPVPSSMVQPCLDAIDIVQRSQWGDADSSDRVELPDGILWRGENSAPAFAIVEGHHLNSFIEWEE